MNNVVMRKVTVGANYQPLTTQAVEVASVEISASPDNAAPVIFMGDDGSEVPFVPGEYFQFQHVNLADFKVKGQPGDTVSIVGGSW